LYLTITRATLFVEARNFGFEFDSELLDVLVVRRPFAKYKSRCGLARTRFMGLAKNMTAYGIVAIAHNVRKGPKFLTLSGLPEPNYAG